MVDHEELGTGWARDERGADVGRSQAGHHRQARAMVRQEWLGEQLRSYS
jgi:hypothetical protein